MSKMNEIISGKKILFITPVFYEYHNKIRQQLEHWNNTVFFFAEREYSLRYSIINNYFHSRIKAEQQKYYFRILKNIEGETFDYIFIIRGFLMPPAFIEVLRKNNPKATFIMHQWDSLTNYDFREYIPLFDKFYSFDPADCDTIAELKYLPNFYLPEYLQVKDHASNGKFDLSFVGSVYDDRLDIIELIIPQLQEKFFYHHCYLNVLGHFKKFILRGKSSRLIKTHPLSLDRAFYILRQSKVILDIHSKGQTGFTYRAIDAIAAGKKLITTNPYIKREKFYNENNILIIDRKKPQIRLDFWDTPFDPVDVSEYSIESWLMKIFS